MPLRAILSNSDSDRGSRKNPAANSTSKPAGHGLVTSIAAPSAPHVDHKAVEVLRSLRDFHLLLRSERLYDKNHPSRLDSLDSAYDSLRQITESLEGLEIRVERGGIVAPKVGEGHLPDARGEMQALASDLHRVGIWSLGFSRKFHVGELDTLARLMKQSLLELDEPEGAAGNAWWPARLLENRVEGISVNTQTDRKVDNVLASLIGALVAYGGHAPRETGDSPIKAPDFDDLMATLRLLARLTPPLEGARGLSPEEAARAIHGAMEEASRESVRMLLHSVSQYAPRDSEQPLPYLLRLSENMILEFLSAEFAGGSLTPPSVRPEFHRLADVLVDSGACIAAPFLARRRLGNRHASRTVDESVLAGAAGPGKIGGRARAGRLVRPRSSPKTNAWAARGYRSGRSQAGSSKHRFELLAPLGTFRGSRKASGRGRPQ